MVRLDVSDFDVMYAESIASPHDRLIAELLGLPGEVRANSSLTGQGLDDVIDHLQVGPAALVIDLGCGRGQLGLEVRRRTGCRILGLDLSPVAISSAREQAEARGETESDVRFVVGDMSATGLPDRCADAIMSIDAIYFGRPLSATVDECARVLRPGGRLVATGWEPLRTDNDSPGRLEAALLARGYRAVSVRHSTDWYAREKQKWLAIAAMPNDGDPMLTSAQDEARSILEIWDHRQRVLVTAERA